MTREDLDVFVEELMEHIWFDAGSLLPSAEPVLKKFAEQNSTRAKDEYIDEVAAVLGRFMVKPHTFDEYEVHLCDILRAAEKFADSEARTRLRACLEDLGYKPR